MKSCIGKKRKAKVKTISKDIEKRLVYHSCFFLICGSLSSLKKCKFSPLSQWNNNYTPDFIIKYLYFIKVEDKKVVVLDMWSAAHLEAFLIKQGMLFLACL